MNTPEYSASEFLGVFMLCLPYKTASYDPPDLIQQIYILIYTVLCTS